MSPIDPTKYVAIHKETVHMEHESRRKYPNKWYPLKVTENYKFYNPDELNAQLKKQLKLQDLCPFEHTGEGEGYFISPDMYKVLLGTCRCGRQRSEAHILRCLQKEKMHYTDLRRINNMKADNQVDEVKLNNAKKSIVPQTSNAYVGWQNERRDYQMWEHSMKYRSPVLTMPGPRITAEPYKVMFIG